MKKNSLREPFISIIIVNYNGIAYTREAVRSVLQHSPDSEVIVVDNCSTDDSVEALRDEFSPITVLSLDENRGFGYGCNRGAEAAKGKYLFFLNNDTLLSEDTPAILASYLEAHPTVGACGPKLLNRDRTFQLSFGFDPSIRNEWIIRRIQRRVGAHDAKYASFLEREYSNKMVDWLTGAALMIRREVFEKVGGFDETFFLYFEDADLCRRIRNAGFELRYVPSASLIHLLGQSEVGDGRRVSVEYRKSQVRYYQKHLSSISVRLLHLYLFVRGFKF